MSDTGNTNSIFKVPKSKSKDILEQIPLTSNIYQSDILPIIHSNLKNSFVSQNKLEITSVWLINNASAEKSYINRRQIMRRTMPKISYSVGFTYIYDFQKLRQIANLGKVEVGNIKNSRLGTSSMGVSLCLFADIYHPGYKSTGVPDKGYLLLVKYLKGKINYVPCDDSPMDPQPQFDCHMVKSPLINTSTSCSSAFNQTQIFIYEYTDDGEIVKYPTKILPYAAVGFKWAGSPLFKMVAHVPRRPAMNENRIKEVELSHFTASQNEKHCSTFSVHHKNATSIVNFELSLRGLPDVKLKSNAYLYFTNPILSLLRSDNGWEISGVIEDCEFEKEFKRLQVIWNDTSPTSSKDLLDPLSQDIIISLNRPNLISSADVDSEAHCFNESSDIPQFVTYTRISLESYEHSKRLCNYLNLSKTMAFIDRPHDPDMSILLFPDGKLSKKLGIPSVEGVYYFHGLVFHSQHPQFIILRNLPEMRKEKDLYFSCLSAFKKQNIQSKLKSLEPLVNLPILKQTVKSQAEVQKAFLFKILKPQTNTTLISYKPICFKSHCDDFECIYHNPAKKIKLNEYTNKENIGNIDTVSDVLQQPIVKVKERHCLSEKLFDYFKNNSNPITDQEIEDERKSHIDERISLSLTVSHLTSVPLTHSKAVTTELVVPSLDIVPPTTSMNHGIFHNSTSHIQNNEIVSGSFLPMEFCSNSKARFSDRNGFHIIEFKHPASIGLFDTNNTISKKLWSFHSSDKFRQHSSWSGTSIFE